MLGSFRCLATASAQCMIPSWMTQGRSSCFAIIWVSASWSGALQFTLILDIKSMKSSEAFGVDDEPSDSGRKVKSGWLEAWGELNWAWATVMEKPLEWRMVPSWSIGVICPCNGIGTSTTWRHLCPCFSIFLLPVPSYISKIDLLQRNYWQIS